MYQDILKVSFIFEFIYFNFIAFEIASCLYNCNWHNIHPQPFDVKPIPPQNKQSTHNRFADANTFGPHPLNRPIGTSTYVYNYTSQNTVRKCPMNCDRTKSWIQVHIYLAQFYRKQHRTCGYSGTINICYPFTDRHTCFIKKTTITRTHIHCIRAFGRFNSTCAIFICVYIWMFDVGHRPVSRHLNTWPLHPFVVTYPSFELKCVDDRPSSDYNADRRAPMVTLYSRLVRPNNGAINWIK